MVRGQLPTSPPLAPIIARDYRPQRLVRRRPLAYSQPVRCMRMCMVEMFVMLAQEILAVVVAVGRTHDGMNVLTRRLIVVQGNARLMVELDEDHRTVNPIIERAHLVTGTDPSKRGFRQMVLHFLQSDLGVTGPDPADVRLDHA